MPEPKKDSPKEHVFAWKMFNLGKSLVAGGHYLWENFATYEEDEARRRAEHERLFGKYDHMQYEPYCKPDRFAKDALRETIRFLQEHGFAVYDKEKGEVVDITNFLQKQEIQMKEVSNA